MTRRLTIIPSIQWHEGMFLSPQHFQQLELRSEQVLSHQLHLLSYCHYGVHSLKVDPILLSDGIIRILEIEAVMPDGVLINFYESEFNYKLECSLKEYKEHGKEVLVHLTMPQRIDGKSSVVSDLPRFESVDFKEVKDENTEDNPIQIPRLIPKLSLSAAEGISSKYVSLPLLKVIFVDDVFIKKDYVPPKFFITKDMDLWQKCAEIASLIRAKASYISEKWKNQIGTPLLQETSNILRPLIASLVEIESILHAHPLHPFVIYQAMCRIASNVSTLQLSTLPPILTPYNHFDILKSFEAVFDLIMKNINTLDETFSEVLFQNRDRLFYLKLHANYAKNRIFVGVRAKKGVSERQLSTWIEDAIIASDFILETVLIQRITGASRTIMQDEDLEELMPSRGVLVFEIKIDHKFIQFEQNLNIFNPADSDDNRPAEIVLYIKND